MFETTQEAAAKYGVTPRTVRAWYHRGEIPGKKIGSRIYIQSTDKNPNDCAIYARVSPGEPIVNLSKRMDSLRDTATQRGYKVVAASSEVARGDLGSKKEFYDLLNDPSNWGTLIIEHSDVIAKATNSWRIVRDLLHAQGRQIVILNSN